jgi:hypothetical protein
MAIQSVTRQQKGISMKTKFAALCLCIGLSGARAEAAGTPRIQFNKTVYDFGVTSGVQSVTGTFTFSNTGDAELSIENPKPSCGCTVASVKPDRLKPGESGELVFTLNMYNNAGLLTKTIAVPSNDPNGSNAVLTVQVDNKPKHLLTPTSLTLGDLHAGTVTNVTIELKRTDGKALAFDRAESGGAVDAQVERIDDQTAHLNLKVLAFGSPRRFTEPVRVYVVGETAPVGTVTIYGRVVGDLAVSPEIMFWGLVNAAGMSPEAMTRRVTVTSTKPDQALTISNLTWDVPEMKVDLSTVEKGKSYAIVARLDQPPKESVHGSVSFSTNLSSQPRVVVPVTINVSP